MAICRPIYIPTFTWSWTLDNDQKSEITDTNKQIQVSFKWGLGSPLATRRRAPLSPGSEIWQGMPPVCFSHVLPGRGPGEDPEIAGVITSLVLSWRRWPRRGKSGPFCLNLLPLWPRSGWAAANGLKMDSLNPSSVYFLIFNTFWVILNFYMKWVRDLSCWQVEPKPSLKL